MISARVKVKIDVPGIRNAEKIIKQESARSAKRIGEYGVKTIRAIQRKDTGKERERTRYRIIPRKLFDNVEFYNTTIQAAVDETGAVPHFPPYKAGSNLFRWVARKGLATRPNKQIRALAAKQGRSRARAAGADADTVKRAGRVAANRAAASLVKRIESIAFAIALEQSRRGLPRPGDKLRKPFETAKPKIDAYAVREMSAGVNRATNRINRGK